MKVKVFTVQMIIKASTDTLPVCLLISQVCDLSEQQVLATVASHVSRDLTHISTANLKCMVFKHDINLEIPTIDPH